MSQFVFIHGWGFDARFWRPLLQELPLKKSACVDLGYYNRAQQPDSIDDDYILVAHSAGLLWALKNLLRPKSVVAINSFPKFTQSLDFPNGVPSVYLRKMQKKWQTEPTTVLQDFQELVRAGYDLSGETIDQEALLNGLKDLNEIDGRPALKAWDCPVLALSAEDDPLIFLPHSQAFTGMGARFDLRLSPSGGHILPLSQPQWCAEQIQEFSQ